MALMTTAEVKSILGITASTYDTQIAYFLPIVEDDIIDYCNNSFFDAYVYRETGSDLAFVRGDSDTTDYISDTAAEFLAKGFLSGMDIYVAGGGANTGLYNISSASTGKLKLTEYGVLINQDQDDTSDKNWVGSIRVSRVKWPNALKLPAAKMIWYLIDDPQPNDALSESLDNYSISYAGSNAYPTRVLQMLDKYRRIEFI
jgi:hypothetical protein